MKGIMWSGIHEAGSALMEGAEETIDWVSKTIDWAAKEAPIAYEKAKPYLETIKDEAIYIGLNAAGLSVIGILLLGKQAQHLVRGTHFLVKGIKKTLVKSIPVLADKVVTMAIGLKSGLADAWQFRNELIAEWA